MALVCLRQMQDHGANAPTAVVFCTGVKWETLQRTVQPDAQGNTQVIKVDKGFILSIV